MGLEKVEKDKLSNAEVLLKVQTNRSILNVAQPLKIKWIGHILSQESLSCKRLKKTTSSFLLDDDDKLRYVSPVHLSVCLCVTRVNRSKTVEVSVMQLSAQSTSFLLLARYVPTSSRV